MRKIHIIENERPVTKKWRKRVRRNKTQHINILYCNINGARGKIRSLVEVLKMEETDIAMLTETKGKPPALEGYTWYSRERTNGKGGGVAIAVRDSLANHVNQPDVVESEDIEVTWIEVNVPGKDKIFIGCYYGLQEKAEIESVTNQFEQLKTQVTMLNHKGAVIMAGDFNAKLETQDQMTSRNGKIMKEFLQETRMVAINGKSITGKWTRVNRKRPTEKSVIDYIVTNQEGDNITYDLEIDERGTKRLKNNRSESDHNTITAKVRTTHRGSTKKTIEKWKINNKSNWESYNKILEELLHTEDNSYQNLEQAIHKSLEKSMGKKIITVSSKGKPRESERVRELRRKKKEKRKDLETAELGNKCKQLQEYYKAQNDLRRAIEEAEKEKVLRDLEEIKNSKDKNHIWKVRKKLLGKKRSEYETKDEEGKIITDPEKARDHIARYFEELYQAREVSEKGREWTEKITQSNKSTATRINGLKHPSPIKEEEMKKAKKKLKKRKSCGPDNIPNEALIYMNKKNTETTRKCLNSIMQTDKVPEAWKNGRIITIYKGKGDRGRCSNERGITVSSNMGKLFERIINDRAKEHLEISDMQGGGKKGANTVDHTLALKEAIRKGKKVYITFLDVTKAYDKAWAEGILYVLEKRGINNGIWKKIKLLNENLSATVETKHGNTRKIMMKDNIRQGGVLSVIMYATLMDEIAKEVKQRNLGVNMGQGTKIGCLLWMDDVALISENKEEMQEMLNITEEIGNRYRIKFGEEKSKILKIGKHLPEPDFKLGDMKLGYCEKYKYLGTTFSNENNMDEHIKDSKRKVEAAYNTAMAIAGSVNFKNIEMRVIWELMETCILPIMTYGWEAATPRKKDLNQLKQICDNIIKRTIMAPKGTPWEPLYMETGIIEPEIMLLKNRLNYMDRIETSTSSILKDIREDQDCNGWWKIHNKTKEELGATQSNHTQSEGKRKKEIRKILHKKMMEKIKDGASKKTKTKFYMDNKRDPKPGNRAKYMDKCNRMDANIIFRARTRMLKVKANYRNMYQDMTCRLCNETEESQEHVLEECKNEIRTKLGKITTQDIFEENTEKLTATASSIRKIMELLQSSSPEQDRPARQIRACALLN